VSGMRSTTRGVCVNAGRSGVAVLGLSLMLLTLLVAAAPAFAAGGHGPGPGARGAVPVSQSSAKYAVFAANDLGMHCFQKSYAGFMILPPANNMKVQVYRRGSEGAGLVTSGIRVEYAVNGNTYSAGKTDFWTYAASYGFPGLKPNVGITGNKLRGTMKYSAADKWWIATAIPVTPYSDRHVFNPLQTVKITVRSTGTGEVLATQPKVVIPVSDEMRCDYCHGPVNTAQNILQAHDTRSGTHLYADLLTGSRHACNECHKDNALGAPGVAGVPPLSQAIHGFHVDRMTMTSVSPSCYVCHPGAQTKCLRGGMAAAGFTCTDAKCHGGMARVADSQGPPSNREAWLQEPTCGGCHGATYAENQGQLYRNSYLANGPEGMNGRKIMCESCHNSPHAEWASTMAVDNAVPLNLQGLATFIKTCKVCHGGERGKIHGGGGG
jgi:hypothetical protein